MIEQRGKRSAVFVLTWLIFAGPVTIIINSGIITVKSLLSLTKRTLLFLINMDSLFINQFLLVKPDLTAVVLYDYQGSGAIFQVSL